MGTEQGSSGQVMGDGSRNAVVIILPSIFSILIITALATAFLSAKRRRANTSNVTEQDRRLQKLEDHIKAEPFLDWSSKEKQLESKCSFSMDICVICLEDFAETSQIRVLGCHHVFHQECVDNWFARWNEYCPLCHQPIIPGNVNRRNKRSTWDSHPPVAFMI
ncbi:hypothetical protein DM02DRAFT_407436 [Periconia macrospinosa]|uniref:RING-type domain-containing protein n=1 Tax=Periconia macrospinosa TaxID=97972 RepID=A0A2V1EBK2_9PLEO|nr:hypothetical protein DM02DRAFT_407436 [Periconia macrospinosa]